MSPWIRENVINEGFLTELKRLKENKCKVKIIFGYISYTKEELFYKQGSVR